jgi:hypothetical protein
VIPHATPQVWGYSVNEAWAEPTLAIASNCQ